jgi:hypothetical protein
VGAGSSSMQPVLVEPAVQPQPFSRPSGFTVAKRPGEKNEDCWQNSHKGAGAVSDGASVSFDSASWSRILARRYAQHPQFDSEWVAEAIATYAKLHDRDNLQWMQQAAFDRGSFASLLGVADRGDRLVASFPYESPEQFDARPQLLSTNPAENAFLGEPDSLSRLSVEWDLGPLDNPALLCVTDALGCWILSERETRPSPIARLRAIMKPRGFARFVEEERAAGRMRRDDTTLLAYWHWSAEPAGEEAPC